MPRSKYCSSLETRKPSLWPQLDSRLELQVGLLSRTFFQRHAQEGQASGMCLGLEDKGQFSLTATVCLATWINAGAGNSPEFLWPQWDPGGRIPRILLFLHPRFSALGTFHWRPFNLTHTLKTQRPRRGRVRPQVVEENSGNTEAMLLLFFLK